MSTFTLSPFFKREALSGYLPVIEILSIRALTSKELPLNDTSSTTASSIELSNGCYSLSSNLFISINSGRIIAEALFSVTSGIEVRLEAITGVAQLIASRGGNPNPS